MSTSSSKHFLTALAYVIDAQGDVTEKLSNPSKLGSVASARLQLLPAIKAAKQLGFDHKILSLHASRPEDLELITRSQITLIGKLSANSIERARDMVLANTAGITRLKRLGSKIVVQYCDNAFHREDRISELYKDIFQVTDYIIYPSEALRDITHKYVQNGTKTYVITDPWQLTQSHNPREIDPNAIKIIWYGSNKNIIYLQNELQNLIANSSPAYKYELTILTAHYALEEIKKTIVNLRPSRSKWSFRLVPWHIKSQPTQLEHEIRNAHIAIIPSDPTDPLKAGVSHNRIVDACRGGCIAVASPMQSYKDLGDITLLGDNMASLLNEAISNYPKYCQNLTNKREELLKKFDPRVNELSWQNFWKDCLKNI